MEGHNVDRACREVVGWGSGRSSVGSHEGWRAGMSSLLGLIDGCIEAGWGRVLSTGIGRGRERSRGGRVRLVRIGYC